jgi:hypothetical protein
VECSVVGETFIRPKQLYTYQFKGNIKADWIVDKKCPVKIEKIDDYNITLSWEAMYSG